VVFCKTSQRVLTVGVERSMSSMLPAKDLLNSFDKSNTETSMSRFVYLNGRRSSIAPRRMVPTHRNSSTMEMSMFRFVYLNGRHNSIALESKWHHPTERSHTKTIEHHEDDEQGELRIDSGVSKNLSDSWEYHIKNYLHRVIPKNRRAFLHGYRAKFQAKRRGRKHY
jgi:hypothetical protein